MSDDIPAESDPRPSSAPLLGPLEDAEGASSELQSRVTGEEDELRSSLAALSQLASAHLALEETLTRIAEFAVAAIPGAEGAGLTLLESGHADTLVASAGFVEEVDAIQYGLGEGPCITAADEARTVRSGDLSRDPQWVRFGQRVAQLGVHSALSMPLLTHDGVLGAMNIYAHGTDVFDDRATLIGELFAVPAAIAVQNAQVLAQTRRLAANLQTALTTRATIDQAIGIVMSRVGCQSEEAFSRLRHTSQIEQRKLHDVAKRIVDEAVRAAHARHSQ